MKLSELFNEGIEVLRTNKLRTGLSALGIIIGISSVIALMTLGAASKQSTIERITSLGSNMLTIREGGNSFGFPFEQNTNTSLKYVDALALKNEPRITSISKVAAEYSSNLNVIFERNSATVAVSGVTPDFFEIRNIQVETGDKFTDSDLELLNKIAIIGPTTAETLFGANSNPIGQSIKIKGNYFKVIGVTKAKGSSGRFNPDEDVYIPLTTAQKTIYGVDYLSAIYVNAKTEDLLTVAENQVGYYLLEKHRITDPSKADFNISSSSDLIETVSQITSTFTTLLSGIAAISLLVGGIGIMNIMLVTVTERTHEIGIRKALGAKNKTIVMQFLLEAMILTITGGVIGVIIGVLASFGLTKFMGLPQIIEYKSILLAVTVSFFVGIVFGWYPAQKASKLQPIEALRYE